MDVEEFTAFLATRPKEEWWQLIEGAAVMMNPPTLAHQRIALNLRDLLRDSLRARRLDLYAYVDVGVRIPGVRNFQPVPDVAVLPGGAVDETSAERYRLVAEVVSPSNTRKTIGLKLRRYREAPDNLYVLIIEQKRLRVEVHARADDWRPLLLQQADDALELPEFGLRCHVREVYEGTALDPGLADSQGPARRR